MIEIFVKGGFFMYPNLVCSILVLAVFLERVWVLRKDQIIPEGFMTSMEELLKNRKLSDAFALCQNNTSSIARIFLAGFKNMQKGMWLIKEAIEERGAREAIILEKNLGILSTISNLSPLIGFLGTVSGMMKTFSAISSIGIDNAAPLARGIAEALINTVVGLCIAIPALICHRYLKDKAGRLIFEMEDNSIRLIELMEKYSTTSLEE